MAKKISFITFWKGLTTLEKNEVRLLIANETCCSISTVDKYGTGARKPNAMRQERIATAIKREYNRQIAW
ncbi:MAG: hypothetical protein J6R74_07195 [Tidjanibacter sp.]|nr:hypothetical protein [Tidjanibacter sp.]